MDDDGLFNVIGPDDRPVCQITADGSGHQDSDLSILLSAAPDMAEALFQITKLNGNLPDSSLDGKCGPNDGASRGLRLLTAIEVARNAILKAGYTEAQ